MKTMTGSMSASSRASITSVRRGEASRAVAQSLGPTGQAPDALVEGRRLRVETPVGQQGDEVDPAAPLLGDGHVVTQFHRPVRLDDHLGGTVDRTEPGPETGRVRHRGRQADEDDVGPGPG